MTACPTDAAASELGAAIDAIDALLPQTQCTRCGYPDCRSYAEAIARDGAAINRCPPGGAEGVTRLASLTGRPALPLNADCGVESPRTRAVIDEGWCIGCTLCIAACPVDCIVGAPKRMHVVVAEDCTGCELCLPACPVDCISLVPASGPRTGWSAWSPADASKARERYQFHLARTSRHEEEHAARRSAKAEAKLDDLAQHSRIEDPVALDRKRAVIEAALARARSKAAPPR